MTRTRAALAIVTGALLVALVGAVPAGAVLDVKVSGGDSNAVVASDGSVVDVAATDVVGSDSFEGTGNTTPSLTAPSIVGEPGIGIDSIIGPDTRFRINPTTGFPARAVVKISFSAGGCTGWMIGPNTVATAGHCVHPGGGGSFYSPSSYTVWPGRNGSQTPFGSCTVRTLFSVLGWTRDGDERYDYGALKLNCNVGNSTGWFGFFWQSASLTGQSSRIQGYPGDKPFGEQWASTDQIRLSQSRQLFYLNDTVGGMSGSPVYRNRPAGSPFCVGYCSMAIHAYGLHGSFPHSSYNHGTRIAEPVFNNLLAWRNAP